jgi:hypothetical protein
MKGSQTFKEERFRHSVYVTLLDKTVAERPPFYALTQRVIR